MRPRGEADREHEVSHQHGLEQILDATLQAGFVAWAASPIRVPAGIVVIDCETARHSGRKLAVIQNSG